jgi:hypothetical protein
VGWRLRIDWSAHAFHFWFRQSEAAALSLIGYVLLVSGWLLVLAALLLLGGTGQRLAFVGAGLVVEGLGLALVAVRYRSLQRGKP